MEPAQTASKLGLLSYNSVNQTPEGATRVFANTSIEESSNYFIIFSVPTIRATGDLVEYTSAAPAKGKQ